MLAWLETVRGRYYQAGTPPDLLCIIFSLSSNISFFFKRASCGCFILWKAGVLSDVDYFFLIQLIMMSLQDFSFFTKCKCQVAQLNQIYYIELTWFFIYIISFFEEFNTVWSFSKLFFLQILRLEVPTITSTCKVFLTPIPMNWVLVEIRAYPASI